MNGASLASLLSGIALAMGVLCAFAALILYAMGKISDTQGGRGEGFMIGCIVASAACFAASAFILSQSDKLNITIP